MVNRELCLPSNTMHTFFITDSESNGIQSPGYYSISMNGRDIARGSTFNEAGVSIFLAGDSASCSDAESRLELEILFHDFPDTISWDIRHVFTNTIVVNQAVTQGFEAATYWAGTYSSNLFRRTLYFDQCLPSGDYVFTICDTSPFPPASPGYFKLSRDGQEFHIGGGDDDVATESVSFSLGSIPDHPEDGYFSGRGTVQVHEKGQVALSSVQIGDLVHVGNGEYEPVYSFGHHDHESRGTSFLQLQTINEKSLVLSQDHLVFEADIRIATPACLVKVGDELLDAFGARLAVVSILPVVARGLYAPFTPSGKIVVDEVMASSFVALRGDDTNVLSIADDLPYHWLAHSFEFPHRVACYYLARCPNEIYNGEGISVWVATPHKHGLWLLEQHVAVRSILLFLLAVVFLTFNLG